MDSKKTKVGLYEPLNKEDTEEQTYGCRANNPNICANCDIPGICAFASKDNICKRPSKAWKKIYQKLKEGKKI
jgi:hypothetical protein